MSQDIEDSYRSLPVWLRARQAWGRDAPGMSKARLVITAVIVEKRPVSEVARSYGVARSWVCALLARYREEGEEAFEARSRRPKTSPRAIPDVAVGLITEVRKDLASRGLDASRRRSPGTWDIITASGCRQPLSAATLPATAWSPQLRGNDRGRLTCGFTAGLPDEFWQPDFTRYRLAGGRTPDPGLAR